MAARLGDWSVARAEYDELMSRADATEKHRELILSFRQRLDLASGAAPPAVESPRRSLVPLPPAAGPSTALVAREMPPTVTVASNGGLDALPRVCGVVGQAQLAEGVQLAMAAFAKMGVDSLAALLRGGWATRPTPKIEEVVEVGAVEPEAGHDGVVWYCVAMRRGSRDWTVRRRYRQWHSLNEGLARGGYLPLEAPFPPKQLPFALRAALCLECGPASAEAHERAAALRLWAVELLRADGATPPAAAAFFGLDERGGGQSREPSVVATGVRRA